MHFLDRRFELLEGKFLLDGTIAPCALLAVEREKKGEGSRLERMLSRSVQKYLPREISPGLSFMNSC